MSPLSEVSGGNKTLVQLSTVAFTGVACPFSATAAAALTHWRARPGMIVTIVDAAGEMWRARLTEFSENGGSLVPFQRAPRPLESLLQLTVYQALPEKERFELILEKLTELGVTRIVPFISRHSSTPEERDAKQQKSHRWPEVLRRAAVQCRRGMIPELGPCLPLADAFLSAQKSDLRLVLYEGEGTILLKKVLETSKEGSVALMIGPEGGFAPVEVSEARLHGFLPVSLGPRILRTETAAISAATLLQFALGDLS